MRYFGILTGRKAKEGVAWIGQEDDKEDFPCYYAEVKDVTDDAGNSYGNLMIWFSGKTALRCKECILPNNPISFDCTEIRDGKVKRIRNICVDKMLCGKGLPCEKILDHVGLQMLHSDDSFALCSYCKYVNNKKQCEKFRSF